VKIFSELFCQVKTDSGEIGYW